MSGFRLEHVRWAPNEDEIIRALWPKGLSATEVAKKLPGRSRNAVIGRAHRLGVAQGSKSKASPPDRLSRAPKVRPQPRAKPPHPGQQGKPAVILGVSFPPCSPEIADQKRAEAAKEGRAAAKRVEAQNIASPNATPFLEAKGGCKWPIGAGLSMLYCCNEVVGGEGVGKVYCAGHRRLAIAAVQPPAPMARNANSFTRHDRVMAQKPKAANDDPFSSAWDEGREVA